jgi:hypothetical protein
LPNAIGRGRRAWLTLVTMLPFVALVGLGAAAWSRGYVQGLWLAPWEIALLAFGLALANAVPVAGGTSPRRSSGGARKRGLPKGEGKKVKKRR